ncbi:MAG TPA: DUF503 domain-containing protein [Actinomycetota bacterium]|nr:DUF503 domain-containing protein [Actinomycetota bacterium]
MALGRFDLRIPGCTSLKEKRHVVKTLTASLRQRFNVAVAEVDHHDLWQRATLGVSSVAQDSYHLKRVMHEVERHITAFPAVELLASALSLHGPED